MHVWEQIRDCRKSGDVESAYKLAVSSLQEHETDIRVRGQLEWVFYDLVKRTVSRMIVTIENIKRVEQADVNELYGILREYATYKPIIPGLAFSRVLEKLCKVGRYFENFLPFVMWSGKEFMTSDDFQPNIYEGRTSMSLSLKVAREVLEWIKLRPDAQSERVSFGVDLAWHVLEKAGDQDKVWLEWSLLTLLRRLGQYAEASTLLSRVLKKKKTEYWTWAEAGRLYRVDQPERSVACYSQALLGKSERKFLGTVHRELAEVLAELGDYGQASQEVWNSAQIYDDEKWKHPPELQALLKAEWYDVSKPAQDCIDFYRDHASEALQLCYDTVQNLQACYLGQTEPRDGKKPRPKYAVLVGDVTRIVIGRYFSNTLRGCNEGTPLRIVAGFEDQRTDVIEVAPRLDGEEWDCCCYLTSSTVPERDRIVRVSGPLRRSPKGFGFVNSVFVPPHMINTLGEDDNYLFVIAVGRLDKLKDKMGWQAMLIKPMQEEMIPDN